MLRDTPPEDLSPVEIAAREWRVRAIEDLGGAETLTATQEALLNAATGSKIILDSLDGYLFDLAARDGLANRRSRRAFPIVTDRMRVADSLARQLQGLGLERRAKPIPTLNEYLSTRYGDNGSAKSAVASAENPQKANKEAPYDPDPGSR